MLKNFEAEFAITRRALAEMKEKMQSRYTKTNNWLDILQQNMNSLDNKFEIFSRRTYTLFENTCTALLDPEGAQGPK